ncbi:MAG: hypothetical protein WC649_09310, partial [Desulfobacteria bacterium]
MYLTVIIPSTGQILKLEGAEEEVVLKEFDERIDVHNIMSTGEDISKTALKSGFTGERLLAKYEGSVKDNGPVTNPEIRILAALKGRQVLAYLPSFYFRFSFACCIRTLLPCIIMSLMALMTLSARFAGTSTKLKVSN